MLLHITTHNDTPQWHRKKLTHSPLGLSGVALHSSSAQISDYGCCSESTLKYWCATEKIKNKEHLAVTGLAFFFLFFFCFGLTNIFVMNLSSKWRLDTKYTNTMTLSPMQNTLGEFKVWRWKYLLWSTQLLDMQSCWFTFTYVESRKRLAHDVVDAMPHIPALFTLTMT